MYFYTFNFCLMRSFFILLFSSLFIIFSCKKENSQNKGTTIQKADVNTSVKHPKYSLLDEESTKEIKKWKEYFITEEFVSHFKSISPTEALNNAIELKDLTKQLKDSLNIQILKTPAFKARINVFENEVLRLADMTYIPSISSKDINAQVEKVLALFGSMNDKINTVYAKKRFDKAIKLDSIFNNFK